MVLGGRFEDALGEYKKLLLICKEIRGRTGGIGAAFALERMSVLLEGMGEMNKVRRARRIIASSWLPVCGHFAVGDGWAVQQ